MQQQTEVLAFNGEFVAFSSASDQFTEMGIELFASGFARASSETEAKSKADLIARTELIERKVIGAKLVLQSPKVSRAFRAAYSNGVAANVDRNLAIQSAKLELIERHQVLYHWYNGLPPQRKLDFELEGYLPSKKVCKLNWQLYLFSSQVAAVFGIPDEGDLTTVPVFGFGAGVASLSAIRKAINETFQRWLVLKDYERNELPTESEASPNFHQDVFSSTEGLVVLCDWLAGKATWRVGDERKWQYRLGELELAENNYSERLLGTEIDCDGTTLQVWKVGHPDAIPLLFGMIGDLHALCGKNVILSELNRGFIHPIA